MLYFWPFWTNPSRKLMDEEPVFEVKPSWGPFTLNLNELWRRLRGQPKGTVNMVAKRFLQLFEAHGVAASQIPRFLPTLNLSTLNTTESLLPALTPAILNEAAQVFGSSNRSSFVFNSPTFRLAVKSWSKKTFRSFRSCFALSPSSNRRWRYWQTFWGLMPAFSALNHLLD
jgi:hypothetical protein